MKLNPMHHILLVTFYFVVFQTIFSQDAKTKYQEYLNARPNNEKYSQNEKICAKQSPCQISFRRDYKEYLDLKYYHKRKLVYHLDKSGYYYFTYNPGKGKGLDFNLKIHVKFNPVISGNKTVEIGIDTETQSGQVYVTTAGVEKPSWKYLLPETPTLSPVVIGEQILVCADHPVEGGKLYSLNAKTGKLDWFFLTPGAILSYPFVFEDFIIVLDDSGNIFWVEKDTGTMRHKFTMEEFPVPNPILKDKILYLAGKRGHLYAIKLSDALPAWRDLALAGEIMEMTALKKGIVLLGGNRYSLFNYTNGAKQDTLQGNHFTD